MTCVGQFKIKLPIYKKFMEENKCISTNDELDNWAHVFILSFSI